MKRQRGFTLAEMIVALAVSALLVSLTYGALRIGVRSWQATQEGVNRLDTLRIGWQTLHDSLIEAVPVADRDADGQAILFKGSPDSLTFAADMPSYLGLGGVYLVELYLEDDGGAQILRLRRTLYSEIQQRGLENHPQQADLAERVRQLSIGYYGKPEDAPLAGWQPDWSGQAILPALVRVDVELQNGDRWPTLIVGPRRGVGQILPPQAELPAGPSAIPRRR